MNRLKPALKKFIPEMNRFESGFNLFKPAQQTVKTALKAFKPRRKGFAEMLNARNRAFNKFTFQINPLPVTDNRFKPLHRPLTPRAIPQGARHSQCR